MFGFSFPFFFLFFWGGGGGGWVEISFPVRSYIPKKVEKGEYSYERCLSVLSLIVCLTIEHQRCGSRRFDRYTAGLHQAMVSTDCVTV